MGWLGQQLGFKRPEDWYQLSTQQLRRWYGRSLLKKFRDPRVAILKEYLPKGDWQEWLFKKSPNGFWQQRANRRRYMDWLGASWGSSGRRIGLACGLPMCSAIVARGC